MISKKQKILVALTEHLEGVNPTNMLFDPDEEDYAPYPVDLRNKVFRGRMVFGDEVTEPFLSIYEAPRQIVPEDAGEGRLELDEDWTLLIQGFAADDKLNPTDPAYQLLACVQHRMARISQQSTHGGRGGLYPDEWRLGGLIAEVRYQIPIVRPGQDDVSGTAYFYMPISVGVVTDLTQPFVEEN